MTVINGTRGWIRTYKYIENSVCTIIERTRPGAVDRYLRSHGNNQWHNNTTNRPRWFPEIRQYLYRQGGDGGSIGPIPVCFCAGCRYGCTPQGLQIDHITGWYQYLTHYDAGLSTFEARVLFNDPENLRLLCSLCNGGHPENQGIMTAGDFQLGTEDRLRRLLGHDYSLDP